jgi:hypothetical protein
MNFYAIFGMGKIPKIELTTRNIIAQNQFFVQKSILTFLTSSPHVLKIRAEPISTIHLFDLTSEVSVVGAHTSLMMGYHYGPSADLLVLVCVRACAFLA